MLELNINIVNW